MGRLITKTAHHRFWEKVEEGPNGCWNWTGATVGGGYGIFAYDPVIEAKGVSGHKTRKGILAHRYAWESLGRKLPSYQYGGLQLDHLCRNRICVNPQHAELVTPMENTMRGETPARKNRDKMTCKYGHAFIPENTYIQTDKYGNDRRRCRACGHRTSRAYKAEVKRRGNE